MTKNFVKKRIKTFQGNEQKCRNHNDEERTETKIISVNKAYFYMYITHNQQVRLMYMYNVE